MPTTERRQETQPLMSLTEPQNAAQLFAYLRDISRVLARDVDRISDELPKIDEQVRLAGEIISLAQSDIRNLTIHARNLDISWERSKVLAETIGATAGTASVKAVEGAVAGLNGKLLTSANAASDAAEQLERAMRFSKAPWILAVFLSFGLTVLAAFLTYTTMKPGAQSDRDVERMQRGILLERMYQKATPKEKVLLNKLATEANAGM